MSVKLKETSNAQASSITQNFRGFFSSSTNHFLPVRSARIVRVVGSKGRRRRSFFDRESSIFRRTKPRPTTSFFFFTTIRLSTSKQHLRRVLFVLGDDTARRDEEAPPYPFDSCVQSAFSRAFVLLVRPFSFSSHSFQ